MSVLSFEKEGESTSEILVMDEKKHNVVLAKAQKRQSVSCFSCFISKYVGL